MQSSISVFLTSFSPPLSGHLLSLPVFISLSFYMTCPFQPILTNFLLKLLHSNLHSQFIHSSLISFFNSQYSSYKVVFANLNLELFFSVGATVSSAFIYAELTHKLSTFPLSLHDMHLSPIIPSTFLQVFAPAVILVITKANYLVDLDQGN